MKMKNAENENERNEKMRPIRSFQRVFVCVPTSNGGYLICLKLNELSLLL